MVRFLFAAVLAALCLCGCCPRSRGAEPPPQCTLRLPQTTLAAAMPANSSPCGCPCAAGQTCTCPIGECRCGDCPGQKVTLDGLKQQAMRDNKRLVVWTGTAGHSVPECLACRDERSTSVIGAFPFVSVGVPSANGLVWWQFPASVPDAALRTVRTDGVYDLMPTKAEPSPSPSDWRYWQTAYPAPYLNAAPLPAGPQWQPFAPQAMSYAPAFGGCPGGM